MKSTTRRPFAAEAAEDRRVIADLEIRKVVREHIPIHSGGTEVKTLGEVVDGIIADALRGRQEIQAFTIEVSESWWADLSREFPE